MLALKSQARRRVAALAAVPALMLVPNESTLAPVAPGLTYTFKMSTQQVQPDGKTKDMNSMVGKGQVAGNSARFEILEAKGAQAAQKDQFGKGSYMLFTEGGKTMTIVDPQNKQYYEMDLAGMMRMLGALGPIMKIEISDVNIDAQPLGAGETIEGYSTQKYRLVSNYTTKMSIIGIKQTASVADTAIYWYAPSLKLVANPFGNATGLAGLVNNPDFDQKLNAAMAKLPKSVPVKIQSRSVSTDGKGKQQASVTTIEFTDIKRGDVPATAFEIPTTYAKIQGPSLTQEQADSLKQAMDAAQQAQAQGDSVQPTGVTDAAKQGAQEAAKEGAKQTAKKKLGKIFGKP
ncbi:MAG TPA: hypothetical protein VJ672_14435 [Gemmatimonadaceae bacterium]|nr:hypothetical protein [Gemmatimonadaceae bacterium]